MNYLQLVAVTVVAVAGVVFGKSNTPVVQCSNSHIDHLSERVQVTPCGATQCRLPRGTNVTVVFKFKPKFEVKKLINIVYARLGGLSLPFLGVDRMNACPQVTRASDGSSAPCPLAANEEYKYTNVFFIEKIYPLAVLTVHWSLNDGKRDVICFEVPAVITPAKKH